jgi:hypothetical protein
MDKRRKSLSADETAKKASAAAAAGTQPVDGEPRKGSPRAEKQQQQQQSLLPLPQKKKPKEEQQLLHVYSIAAPGMRRAPETTQDLAACAAWTAAINMKRGWRQKQKGFFDAPGEAGGLSVFHTWHLLHTSATCTFKWSGMRAAWL